MLSKLSIISNNNLMHFSIRKIIMTLSLTYNKLLKQSQVTKYSKLKNYNWHKRDLKQHCNLQISILHRSGNKTSDTCCVDIIWQKAEEVEIWNQAAFYAKGSSSVGIIGISMYWYWEMFDRYTHMYVKSFHRCVYIRQVIYLTVSIQAQL